MPTLQPVTSGSWKRVSARAIEFTPTGYGYGLNARVQIVLPGGVHLVGGQSATASSGSWTVPNGSLIRAQQLLAQLGYLPVNFKYKGRRVGRNPSAQEAAAVDPPAGRFVWRYPNTPDQLKAQWQPGQDGVVTKGAIMMFESDHGMTTDGILSPAVWKALIDAAAAGKKSGFGYSFVMVHEADSGETTTLWHNGQTIITTPANTGAAAGGYPDRHLPGVRAPGVDDHVGHQPRRLHLRRSRDPLGQLLQRRRRAALLRPRLLWLPAVRRVRRDAAGGRRQDLAVHAGRRAGRRQHLSHTRSRFDPLPHHTLVLQNPGVEPPIRPAERRMIPSSRRRLGRTTAHWVYPRLDLTPNFREGRSREHGAST